MEIKKLLEANDDIKLNCPDCYDVWYGEDCPTFCVTCGCTSGMGTMSLEDILSRITFKNLHREVDTGDSVGNEF